MTPLDTALQYAQAQRARWLDELRELVRIPSIPVPAHAADCQRAAEWVAGRLRRTGLEHVAVEPTEADGNPVGFGGKLAIAPGAPVILLYGHYDVQPAEPLAAWEVEPFDL